MTLRDIRHFAALMLEMAALYRYPLGSKLMALYWQDLKVLSLSDLKIAWQKHRLTAEQGRYMPKPIDLLTAGASVVTEEAEQAWLDILQQVRDKGPYQRFEYSNPVVKAVVAELGGQGFFCQSSNLHLNHQRQLFIRCYQAYLGRVYDKQRQQLLLADSNSTLTPT